MALHARLNNSGFTLIELMVGMVIMMVGLLGLLNTVNVALVHNLSNQLRNDAVQVADEQMVLEMAKPFNLISTNATPNQNYVSRKIYSSFKNYSYSIVKTGSNVSDNTKSVVMQVNWKYKGQSYNHSISSLISKFNQ